MIPTLCARPWPVSRARPQRLTFTALLTLICLVSFASASALSRRDEQAILPPPLSINPDQNWDGVDGNWSTFTLSIGTPPQFVRVYASTASQQVWAVDSQGCEWTTNKGACVQSRGWLFNSSKSSSWKEQGIYSTFIEDNLGIYGSANYGLDNVTLGGFGEGGPELQDVVVGSQADYDFYLGIFGLHPKPTNFTNFNNGSASFMSKLKESAKIPSLSYGYTAGAKYRTATGVLASLTLGGVDQNRFVGNSLYFPFAPDSDRDLVVTTNSITVTTNAPVGSAPEVLLLNSASITMYIDSTVAGIWLPTTALAPLEDKFGLTWDNQSQLYLINDTQHQNLLDASPNFTFSISPTTGGSAVQITLPYAALDQWALSPYQNMTTNSRYLPFHRAALDNQYTLGRAFLQEAYLAVDYERQYFNLSSCAWGGSQLHPSLVTIAPVDTSPFPKRKTLSGGAIAGIVIGVIAALAILALLGLWLLRRHRRRRSSPDAPPSEKTNPFSRSTSGRTANSRGTTLHPLGQASQSSLDGMVFPKAELDGGSPSQYAPSLEPPGSSHPTHSSIPPTPRSPLAQPPMQIPEPQEIYEMPGDTPVPQEMPTRAQMSETAKEADMRRAEQFNGDERLRAPRRIALTEG